MQNSKTQPIISLILALLLVLSGCNLPTLQTKTAEPSSTSSASPTQEVVSPTGTGTTPEGGNPTSVAEPTVVEISPTETKTPREPSASALFLPTLFNNSHTTPYSEIPVTQNQELTPENWQEWPVIPVIDEHAVEIYQAGLAQGNNPTHFSKVGDCQNIRQYFLGLFDDTGTFRLGEQYAYLQETIDYYSGSWSRLSEAVRTGFNVASVLAPLQANPEACNPAETPLACEIRLWNPSFVIISMETWTSDRPVDAYDGYLRQIVEYAISKNVLPIVATKADNLEGDQAINQIIAKVAADYDIPMWNFWAATHPLTDEGLREDRFHLTNGPNYYDSAQSLDLGWPVRNLTGLLLVDAVWKTVR